ncbi:MAG: polysaccharide deacetylase family protein [Phycisphaerae bacterium]
MAVTAASAGILSGGALLAYSVFMPRCQFWAPVIRSIPDRETVALTFDDGPHPDFTPRILDILAQHHAHATFFVIGRYAKQHPDLIQRIANEGHTLGNHTLDHDRFGVNQKRDYWRTQIHETQRIVADITGQPPVLFRSPMGFKTGHIARAAKEARLPFVGWSVRSLDTRPLSAQKLVDRVLARTAGHDIILLHDGIEPNRTSHTASQQNTVDALPVILEGLADKKLRPLSLLEALIPAAETPLLARGRA